MYAGWHVALDCPIAIKVVRIQGRGSDLSLAFLEEAKLLSRLRHPNIVRVLDVGILPANDQTALRGWLVMEWCEGSTLADHLSSERTRSPRETWRLLAPAIDAVAAAHEAGIVHRDLKPSNIMMVEESKQVAPRLIDFGIAKRLDGQLLVAASGQATLGKRSFTPAYAAPEQLAGLQTGPWTDVHALGLLLVETLTGKRAYGDVIEPAVIMASDRPTPKRHGVDVGEWETVLEKALSLRTSHRHANARELFQALERTLPLGQDDADTERDREPERTLSSAQPRAAIASGGTLRSVAGSPPMLRLSVSGLDTTLKATESPPSATATPILPRRWAFAALGLVALIGSAWVLLGSSPTAGPAGALSPPPPPASDAVVPASGPSASAAAGASSEAGEAEVEVRGVPAPAATAAASSVRSAATTPPLAAPKVRREASATASAPPAPTAKPTVEEPTLQ